jgi:serine/threonine protein kinase
MKKLANGVTALHKLGMVHLDLLPKNILVNIYNGQVVDIAMTDFGNVIHRTEWFFDQTMKMRDQFVRYFLEHKELEDVGRGIVENNPAPDADGFQMTYYWLLNEPDNFDWALLERYNLGPSPVKVQEVPWISLPPRFNFSLPWSRAGQLDIQVKFDGAMHPLGEINGLWTLKQLRRFAQKRYPQLKGLHLTWEAAGAIQKVAFRQQNEFLVSTVIRKDQGYFVEFL